MEVPLYRGGFADVWKGTSQGREVAVKVLRVYSMSDFGRVKRVANTLLMSCVDELTIIFRDSAGRLRYGKPFAIQTYYRC